MKPIFASLCLLWRKLLNRAEGDHSVWGHQRNRASSFLANLLPYSLQPLFQKLPSSQNSLPTNPLTLHRWTPLFREETEATGRNPLNFQIPRVEAIRMCPCYNRGGGVLLLRLLIPLEFLSSHRLSNIILPVSLLYSAFNSNLFVFNLWTCILTSIWCFPQTNKQTNKTI